jgi:molybdate transport system substrate-binding protein
MAWLAVGVLAVALAGCGGTKKDAGAQPAKTETVELVVSAAASLTDSLRQLQTNWEAKHPDVKLRFNFGASGVLQQQIEQGAPADLFISAAAKNMQALVDKGLIDKTRQTILLKNELVLIVPKTKEEPVKQLADLAKPETKRIAVGEPESVPAGGYAKEALTNAGLWDALQAKLVFCKDVRQVLTYVESGNADAGFVYRTDALTSKQVTAAQPMDAKLYTPVEYPIGVVKATSHAKEAQELYDYLKTKEASDVFAGFGFTPVKP